MKLYVQVDSMGEALVSIEHLNKACLHVQRLFRGRVGRNIAKNMRARVFLSRASIDYFTYRSSISNGTYVKHVAAQDREKERLAKKQNRVHMEISFHREKSQYSAAIRICHARRSRHWHDPLHRI